MKTYLKNIMKMYYDFLKKFYLKECNIQSVLFFSWPDVSLKYYNITGFSRSVEQFLFRRREILLFGINMVDIFWISWFGWFNNSSWFFATSPKVGKWKSLCKDRFVIHQWALVISIKTIHWKAYRGLIVLRFISFYFYIILQ